MTDTADFRSRVWRLWRDSLDTKAIAYVLQVRECDVERALHRAMEIARGTGKLRKVRV